jgi:hypothetical protein
VSSPLNSSNGTAGKQSTRLEPQKHLEWRDSELGKKSSKAAMERKTALRRAAYHAMHTLHEGSMFLL